MDQEKRPPFWCTRYDRLFLLLGVHLQLKRRVGRAMINWPPSIERGPVCVDQLNLSDRSLCTLASRHFWCGACGRESPSLWLLSLSRLLLLLTTWNWWSSVWWLFNKAIHSKRLDLRKLSRAAKVVICHSLTTRWDGWSLITTSVPPITRRSHSIIDRATIPTHGMQ